MADETIENWTRGDLYGEWAVSEHDIVQMLGLNQTYEVGILQTMEELYSGKDSRSIIMTTNDALQFNASYRNRQLERMKNFPWDQNMLDAYHNLHFILYMADKMPKFDSVRCEGKTYRGMDVPGRDLWVFQLIMKAATVCLRDDFIKVSTDASNVKDYRFGLCSDLDGNADVLLHVAGGYLFFLNTSCQPTVKKNGTFGCKYGVSLSCLSCAFDSVPVTGKAAVKNPLKKNLFAMKKYIEKELNRFSKMLDKAEFNQPEYALAKLNKQD